MIELRCSPDQLVGLTYVLSIAAGVLGVGAWFSGLKAAAYARSVKAGDHLSLDGAGLVQAIEARADALSVCRLVLGLALTGVALVVLDRREFLGYLFLMAAPITVALSALVVRVGLSEWSQRKGGPALPQLVDRASLRLWWREETSPLNLPSALGGILAATIVALAAVELAGLGMMALGAPPLPHTLRCLALTLSA